MIIGRCNATGRWLAGLLFVFVMLPQQAPAVLIDVSLGGQVTRITNGQLTPQFSIGQSMSATLTFDGATLPETSLILTRLLYKNAVLGGNATVGTYNAVIGGGNINISNDDPTFFDSLRMRGGATGPGVGALSPTVFGIVFEDASQQALSDKLLPQTTTDLAGFTDRSWALAFGTSIGTDPPLVGGRLTSLTLTPRGVPEPHILLLLCAGLVGALHAGRRPRPD